MLVYFLLALSIFLLVLTGGMAWMVRGFQGYFEQRGVGIVSWVFYMLTTFFMFKVAGVSTGTALILLFFVSTVGYFGPDLEALLLRRFKDPGETIPRAPIK